MRDKKIKMERNYEALETAVKVVAEKLFNLICVHRAIINKNKTKQNQININQ